MTAPNKAEIGRIALRVEGGWWNAYWAPRTDSMEGAVHLCGVLLALVQGEPEKEAFIALARMVFARAVKDATGQTLSWNAPVAAPEHERSGRA